MGLVVRHVSVAALAGVLTVASAGCNAILDNELGFEADADPDATPAASEATFDAAPAQDARASTAARDAGDASIAADARDASADVHDAGAFVDATRPPTLDAGTSPPDAGTTGGCPSGFGLCSGTCVDLQNDRKNCGVCGNKCKGNVTCTGGHCIE